MSESVGGLHYDVTLQTKQLIEEARRVEERLTRIAERGNSVQSSLTKVAAAVAAAMSAIAIEGLVSKIVTAQRQFDVIFASLKTMTGGVDQAGAAFDRLREFASKTPYSLEQAVNGFVKLKALGLDPSERAMTSFGNTASAMGKDLSQMIEAVADASTGEFERLKEFGIKAKVNGDQVSLTFQGVTTTVRNSAAEITEDLTKIGEVNFAGAMSERMKTLDGDISNLEDAWAAFYLAVSQSGFGDAVASGVQMASKAIQEMTTSIKQGGLTEYFDGLKTILPVVEVAVVSLAGVIASRLVVALIAAAAQAYATATAMGVATVAARGFGSVMALLGGPIGIAVTALGLLVLNWDKISSSARTAAEISEDAASRIAGALRKSGGQASGDLANQLKEAEQALAAIDKKLKLAPTTGGRSLGLKVTTEQLDKLKEQKAAYLSAINEIKKAQESLGRRDEDALRLGAGPRGGAGKGYEPDKVKETPKPDVDKFDDEAHLSALRRAQASEIGIINETETEKLRLEKKLLDDREISQKTYNEAVTLIVQTAEDDRLALMRKTQEEIDKDRKQAAEREQRDRDQQKSNQDVAKRDIAAVNPIDAIRFEEEQKIAVLESYRLLDLANAQLYEDAKAAIHKKAGADVKAVQDAQMLAQMQGFSNLFGGIADITKTFAGEQSGIYKAMFVTQKAFAIASAIVSIQKAYADAAASGATWPEKLTAMASISSATAGIVSTIAGTNFGGGRQYGGPVTAGSLYRVNEGGKPEMFTAGNGNQYLMPTQGGKVTPMGGGSSSGGSSGSGGGDITVNVSVNVAADGSSTSETSTSSNAAMARQLGDRMGQISKDTISREMRPGGLLWKMKVGQI